MTRPSRALNISWTKIANTMPSATAIPIEIERADPDADERDGHPEQDDQQDVDPAGDRGQREPVEHGGDRVGLDLWSGHRGIGRRGVDVLEDRSGRADHDDLAGVLVGRKLRPVLGPVGGAVVRARERDRRVRSGRSGEVDPTVAGERLDVVAGSDAGGDGGERLELADRVLHLAIEVAGLGREQAVRRLDSGLAGAPSASGPARTAGRCRSSGRSRSTTGSAGRWHRRRRSGTRPRRSVPYRSAG